jgi:predicted Zn-dependent protease
MWVRVLLAPLIVAFLAGGAAAQAPLAPAGDASARSQRGKELMAAGRYAEAAAVYRELVRSTPGNAGLLVNLGMALHLAGKDEDAIPPLEGALRLQPDSVPGNLFLGAARLGAGRGAASVAPLQKAVRLQPDNLDARSMLAEALLGLGRLAEAEPHLRRLTALAPTDPAAWFNLGKAYEDLAAQSFDALVDRDPESAYAVALVAEAKRKEGQRTAAFPLYRQALERRPEMRGLHAALAAIYRESGHADWAAIEDGRERRLPRADCARDTLECAFAAGRYGDVVAAAAPLKTPEAAYWLARSYDELARQALARLTALPPSVHSHEWLAQIARRGRRYAESAQHWRQALALAPGDPRLMTELAVTLRMNRDLAGAQRLLEDVLRKAPDAPEPNYLLGDLLLARDEPERAIPLLEKAVKEAPEEPHGQGALGRAYALVGRPADAIPHLKEALPVDADGSLRLQLARAYQAAGRTELARAAMKDYEDFKKAMPDGADPGAPPAAITPPDGASR